MFESIENIHAIHREGTARDFADEGRSLNYVPGYRGKGRIHKCVRPFNYRMFTNRLYVFFPSPPPTKVEFVFFAN